MAKTSYLESRLTRHIRFAREVLPKLPADWEVPSGTPGRHIILRISLFHCGTSCAVEISNKREPVKTFYGPDYLEAAQLMLAYLRGNDFLRKGLKASCL